MQRVEALTRLVNLPVPRVAERLRAAPLDTMADLLANKFQDLQQLRGREIGRQLVYLDPGHRRATSASALCKRSAVPAAAPMVLELVARRLASRFLFLCSDGVSYLQSRTQSVRAQTRGGGRTLLSSCPVRNGRVWGCVASVRLRMSW